MKKAKTIIIIVLVVLLLVGISINVVQYIWRLKLEKETDVIIENNNKKENVYIDLLQDREKTISEYKLNKPKTEKEIVYYETIKKDTKFIEELRSDNKELKDQLVKTNKALKNIYKIKHGLSMFALAGIDRDLEFDLYTGITYRRYMFNGRFFVGGGVAVKLYDEIGIGITLEIGINF